jgi:CAAX protease family protein
LPFDPPTDSRQDPANRVSIYRVAWTFYLVLAIAGVIWIGTSQGSIPLALFVDPAAWWLDLGLGLAGGLGLVALWDLGRRYVVAMRELEKALAQQIGLLDPSEALALAVISGFSEELFFRGAVQTSWGWAWATAIFTLMHFGKGRVFRWWTVFAFVAALVFGGLTLHRGTILAAVVAHTVVNAVNLRRLAAEAGTQESAVDP